MRKLILIAALLLSTAVGYAPTSTQTARRTTKVPASIRVSEPKQKTAELGELRVTYYSAVGSQLAYDSIYVASHFHKNVDTTYSIFSPNDATRLKWCAVSQDLLWYKGGPLRYGDRIHIERAGSLSGTYTVKDCMHPSMRRAIDILLSVKDYHGTGVWFTPVVASVPD